MPKAQIQTRTVGQIVGVHLDLKGVMPKPAYLPVYLADLKAQGVNTLLVEYEDAFPFAELELAADPATVWTPAGLRRFLRLAAAHGLEVIPLQQCLGHLEYLLRWKRYRRFAEDRAYPSTIRLADPRARALIRDMLRQVMAAHPDSRFVHLGMDEAHALVGAARRAGREPLEMYVEYLRELCDFVEAHGKKPVIWADMLQDHFIPGLLDEFKNRVVLGTWNYHGTRAPRPEVRLGGHRVSRRWLGRPQDPQAPPLAAGTPFVEDLPPAVQRLLQPAARGDGLYDAYMAEEFWTCQGFAVIGHTAVRCSAQGAVLPDYNHLKETIAGYAEAVRRTGQLGLIATSWERGNTFCPPNFNIDLTWPLIGHLGACMGRRPAAFWPGIPEETVTRLLASLGRCRKDWRIEADLAAEMEKLAPRVQAHRHEWDSLRLLAQVLHLHRRCEFAELEVDYFTANSRPVPSEWRRRLLDQAGILRELRRLRRELRRHFGRRFYGEAFNEWLRELFDLHEQRLLAAGETCRRKQRLAAAAWGRG